MGDMKATTVMKATQVKVIKPVKAAGGTKTLETPMKATTASGIKETKVSTMKEVKKISARLAKARVFRGAKDKTGGGLRKADLTKTRTGRVVSKKASIISMKLYPATLAKWTQACMKARKALGIEGFVAVSKGSALYEKARELYKS